jgi:diguanylate cyclase
MAIERLTPGIDLTAQQLEAALERDEFELYYQPLINLMDASICGVEALIRWNHPKLGQVMPAQFIPFAEESGMIVALGTWALRQACTEMRLLRPEHQEVLLSVNVSARQLDEPDFVRGLADILEATGVPARLLQLEITESIFLRDAMRVGALFQAIRALGVKIAFDDFGTGYSSLSYLAKYPVDLLKVDQSFVQRMNDGHASKEIVQLIVRLAQVIGLNVSAEGVEDPEQAAALLGLGCTVAQGYLYSRPVPLHMMVAMLEVSAACCVRKSVRPKPQGAWATGARRFAVL